MAFGTKSDACQYFQGVRTVFKLGRDANARRHSNFRTFADHEKVVEVHYSLAVEIRQSCSIYKYISTASKNQNSD